MRFMGWHFR